MQQKYLLYDKKYLRWSYDTTWQHDKNNLIVFNVNNSNKISAYLLNGSGAYIWALLDGTKTLSDLKKIISKNATYSNIIDVISFIKTLQKNSLIISGNTKFKKIIIPSNKYFYQSPPEIKHIRTMNFEDVTNDYYYLLKEFGSFEQLSIPKVDLDVTFKCNLRCSYCYYSDNFLKTDVNTDKLKRIIDSLRESNIRVLNMTGGEPFIRSDIFEIISYAKLKGLKLILNTNGTLLNKEMADRLKSISPYIFLRISIDGTEKKHDMLRGKGTYKKTWENIKYLNKIGIPMRLSFVAMHKNTFDVLPLYLKLLKYPSIKDLNISLANRIGSAKNKDDLTPRLNDLVFLFSLKFIFRLSKKLLLKMPYFEIVTCAAYSFTHIDCNGNVHFCDQMPRTMPLGNVLENDILTIWHSERYQSLFNHEKIGEPCKSCLFKSICEKGCRASLYSTTGNFFSGNIYCKRGEIGVFTSKLKSLLAFPVNIISKIFSQ